MQKIFKICPNGKCPFDEMNRFLNSNLVVSTFLIFGIALIVALVGIIRLLLVGGRAAYKQLNKYLFKNFSEYQPNNKIIII